MVPVATLKIILTIHVWICQESPPAGASTGVDNSSQELPATQLHRLHLCSSLVHTHQDTQNQRQNHQGAHAEYLSVCSESSKPTAALLCYFAPLQAAAIIGSVCISPSYIPSKLSVPPR